MISLLASILFTGSALALPSDSLTMTRDSLSSTTLREVTIRPDSMLPVQRIVEEIIRKEREEQIHVPTLGEFLQKRFPLARKTQ